MNALTSTSFKLTTLALSAGLVWSGMGGLIEGFQHQGAVTQVVQLPTVVIIGHREVVESPLTLQADAKPVAKRLVKAGA